MFKIAKSILIAATIATSLNAASAVKVSKNEIKNMENLALFKRANITISEAYDTGSVYLLKIVARGAIQEIYLTKDKKYLIAGDVIDTTSGEKLTVPVDISKTIGKEAFTYGNGKDEYVLFTDPECPYCKKFEAYFPQIEDKVKIRVFYFPLDFHPNAKDLSIYAMSKDKREDKIKAMLNVDKNSQEFKDRKIPKDKLASLEKHLEEQMKIGRDLGVRGTPSLFDTKGNKVNWVQMLQNYGVQVK